ncbi:polyribonucleotide nucleotidyltransferase [Candidatus Omnitrophota bacterium]
MKNSKTQATLDSGNIVFSTGDLAKQANGAVLVELNDTVILVTACMSKDAREEIDFFPLLVDYQERTYAAGRIPGGFFKREGRPKDIEILSGRIVDRTIRPLFPEGMRNSVQVVCTVLSSDAEHDPDILAVNGASCALAISNIPFNGPIAAVRVIKTKDGLLLNPTYKQREEAEIDLLITGNKEKIMMLEADADSTDEETALEAIKFGHGYIKELITAQENMVKEVGRAKKEVTYYKPSETLVNSLKNKASDAISKIAALTEKEEKAPLRKDLIDELTKTPEFAETDPKLIKQALEKIEKQIVRTTILKDKKRPDGRKPHDLREISCQVGVLPRTHGSAIFTRGQTQALAVTTLGTTADEQMIEALEGKSYKSFMLHYSFPPYSVGETSFLRGPSRRETGHGALAEKSLKPLLPSKDDFPYTIRVVSEILESNGSSSMASVCASTLSMMDAGVPIKEPAAGVAIGLITDGDEHIVLVDIAGIEDYCGDMDFKVAGGAHGITSIQMDLKIAGISHEVLREAMMLSKQTRTKILDIMTKTLDKARAKVSKFAPKIVKLKIQLDKVGELIGPGGRTIKKIISQAGVAIDIDDETCTVTISAEKEEALNKGVKMVEEIIRDLEIGKVYKARVAKIMNFGAFCDIGPTKSGLIHVSELSNNFVKSVRDVVSEGDELEVKVINIDDQGKVNLSLKQLEKPTEDKPGDGPGNEKRHR